MNIEGSTVSSQRSSSNEYFTADELFVDGDVDDGIRHQQLVSLENQPRRVRVVGIMDAIRSGWHSTFDRSPKPNDGVINEEDEDGNPTRNIQNFSAQFYSNYNDDDDDEVIHLDCVQENEDRIVAVKSCDDILESMHKEPVTPNKKVTASGHFSKYEKDEDRPVFGFDTRTFGRRSNSDHALSSKDVRLKFKSRRKRLTWPNKPPFESEKSEIVDDANDRKKPRAKYGGGKPADGTQDKTASHTLVGDVMRKAVSVLTVENVLQDCFLSYADLQKGDVRFSKDFVFWEEDAVDSATTDRLLEEQQPKFVSTPYPKRKSANDCNTSNFEDTISMPAKLSDGFEQSHEDTSYGMSLTDERFHDSQNYSALTDVTPLEISTCQESNDGQTDQNLDENYDTCTVTTNFHSLIGTPRRVRRRFTKEDVVNEDDIDAVELQSRKSSPARSIHEAAEDVVSDVLTIAQQAASESSPTESADVRQNTNEPQCWEDLLVPDDNEDVISLSDFNMSEITYIKDEIAKMKETFEEVAKDIKNNQLDGRDECGSRREKYNLEHESPQLCNTSPRGNVQNEVGHDASNVLQGTTDRKTRVCIQEDTESTDPSIRTKITFWEGIMKYGSDSNNVEATHEIANEIVSCNNDDSVLSTNGESNCAGEDIDESQLEEDRKNELNYSQGAFHENVADTQQTPEHVYTIDDEKTQFTDEEAASEATHEIERSLVTEECTPPSKVKTRISIWEKLPLRRGNKREQALVNLNSSTKEKVEFFEKFSSSESSFSRRSSSRFSFMKDDWFQRFRKNNNKEKLENTLGSTDVSYVVLSPHSNYESGIWTNEAFFENTSLGSGVDNTTDENIATHVETKLDSSRDNPQIVENGADSFHKSSVQNNRQECDSEWSFIFGDPSNSKSNAETGLREGESATNELEEIDTRVNCDGSKVIQTDAELDNGSVEEYRDVLPEMASDEGEHMVAEGKREEFFDASQGGDKRVIGGRSPITTPESHGDDQAETTPNRLEIVGSKMKLHETLSPDLTEANAKTSSKPKKRKLLSFFRRKSKEKKIKTANQGAIANSGEVVNTEEEPSLDYVDKMIAKKSKKSKSNDWGFIDLADSNPKTSKKRWKVFRRT